LNLSLSSSSGGVGGGVSWEWEKLPLRSPWFEGAAGHSLQGDAFQKSAPGCIAAVSADGGTSSLQAPNHQAYKSYELQDSLTVAAQKEPSPLMHNCYILKYHVLLIQITALVKIWKISILNQKLKQNNSCGRPYNVPIWSANLQISKTWQVDRNGVRIFPMSYFLNLILHSQKLFCPVLCSVCSIEMCSVK
jgi:hypothetical protein